MCGIAGMLSLTTRPLAQPEIVQTLTRRLVHRGPDEAGYYLNPSRTVCLGHRRLRIIDLKTGRQPLGNEDDSVMVTFNGEIYGFQPIRAALEARGHRFRTNTDTEVIVHLYEDEGISCLDRLKGMFAFGLWDEWNETLWLVRDRLGKKPLYYALHQGVLVFASELQALLAVPGLPRKLDELALDQYFTLGYIPAPRTIYEGVKKLEAGHYLVIKSGDLHQVRYWAPCSFARSSHGLPMRWEEAKEELVNRLRTATALRMVSDVPIGCFLSGGVDSSTVLSFMAEQSPQPVRTFSIGFPEEDYSELAYARFIARHFGTDHREYILEPDGVAILEKLVGHFGEPFADPAALPTWYLSQLTREAVTVALTGDGGDELFGGYAWYRTGRMLETASLVPQWLARAGSRLEKQSNPRLLQKIGKAAVLVAASPGERYAMLRQLATPAVKGMLYSREFLSRTGQSALHWLADRYDEIEADDSLNRMMATDLMTYMADDLLVKVDRMSMAYALECRSPLLDADLVEWVLGLPSSYKISSNGGKRLLREAVRDRFPARFLDRPKQGFEVPLERWFRGDLREVVMQRVLHGPLADLGVFDRVGLRQVVHGHFTGQVNHEAIVWALLVLATWVESAVAGGSGACTSS